MIAITRAVSRSIDRCELTHVGRIPIDLARARSQHAEYEAALRRAGVTVVPLPEEPELPDSVFVEDTAVVLDGIAVVTRPGAESRRPEVESVATELARHLPIARIEAPGTVDGGDVLVAGRVVFAGVGDRTNAEGFRQLAAIAAAHGYEARSVPIGKCLHLKTAVTALDDRTLLANPEWIDVAALAPFRIVEVDPAEPFAANVLRANGVLFASAAFPNTRAKLEALGSPTVAIEADELAKAEGALTCCSLLVG